MNQIIPIAIRGTGSAVPARVVRNADFEACLDTTDEWIVSRTGIRERRRIEQGEDSLTLAEQAARMALEEARMTPSDLDLVLVSTITPSRPLPSTACYLQAKLGAHDVPAFDLVAACSGFLYGLINAAAMIRTGLYTRVLLVGVDTLSTITDFEDRRSCVLFGDAAGAAVIERSDDPRQGLLARCVGADGSYADRMWIPAGGSTLPASQNTIDERLQYMKMNGKEVYKFAVPKLQEIIRVVMADAGVTIEDVALIIPHQSNKRIIESALDKLGIPHEKMYINIERFGNTSAASVPLCLDEARRNGVVKSSDLVLLASIGAGFTWASALVRL